MCLPSNLSELSNKKRRTSSGNAEAVLPRGVTSRDCFIFLAKCAAKRWVSIHCLFASMALVYHRVLVDDVSARFRRNFKSFVMRSISLNELRHWILNCTLAPLLHTLHQNIFYDLGYNFYFALICVTEYCFRIVWLSRINWVISMHVITYIIKYFNFRVFFIVSYYLN